MRAADATVLALVGRPVIAVDAVRAAGGALAVLICAVGTIVLANYTFAVFVCSMLAGVATTGASSVLCPIVVFCLGVAAFIICAACVHTVSFMPVFIYGRPRTPVMVVGVVKRLFTIGTCLVCCASWSVRKIVGLGLLYTAQ